MSDGSTTLRGTPNPEAPNPQLPIVQRLRIRFAKRGRLRFTSHRDFGRAFERAVRRARVPIAFSSGYTPHPKISFAGAAPTGAASEAEFLEIGLTETRDPEAVRAALDDALPPGIDILEVVAARQGAGSLADRLEASEWVIELRDTPVERAQEAADAFLAAEQVDVERMTKRGMRTFDARAAVQSLSVGSSDGPGVAYAILTVVVRHQNPSVRPDDVLSGLRIRGDLTLEQTPLATRSAQGPLDAGTGTVGDPLALDRDAP
ncbi:MULTISPECIES: TIGR03936 family radical SAM-associated protein [Aeromicrobium]|jgi:radical SAM-linked protein|uniref:TIGR03936 family radical SAM-associated protein n=1 Tax=Aeromicrobium TaxID=2040 RepID=UPI00082B80AF|nr:MULTISPECIES: TIGR03936 family radical SAM-associated protein [Aeromicrobium]